VKIIQLIGIRKSGKTTTAEVLISNLKKRGYSVGTIKMIECPAFTIDNGENSNTRRHRTAGADVVIAAGKKETDIMYNRALDINEMIAKLEETHVDFCIVEGGYSADLQRIICLKSCDEFKERYTAKTICISGCIADKIDEYENIPAISAITSGERLTDFVIENAKEEGLPINIINRPASVRDYCKKCTHTKDEICNASRYDCN